MKARAALRDLTRRIRMRSGRALGNDPRRHRHVQCRAQFRIGQDAERRQPTVPLEDDVPGIKDDQRLVVVPTRVGDS